jgi:hypothetical protein
MSEVTQRARRLSREVPRLGWRDRAAKTLDDLANRLDSFDEARFEIAQRMSALYDLADEADDDGSHIGLARIHRAMAQGVSEALLILDRCKEQHETAVPSSADPPPASDDEELEGKA